MIRLFVRFPLRPALRLLVLLHAFLLLLGCLPIHLLLLLVRLPGLACIFFDTHALSFSRYATPKATSSVKTAIRFIRNFAFDFKYGTSVYPPARERFKSDRPRTVDPMITCEIELADDKKKQPRSGDFLAYARC